MFVNDFVFCKYLFSTTILETLPLRHLHAILGAGCLPRRLRPVKKSSIGSENVCLDTFFSFWGEGERNWGRERNVRGREMGGERNWGRERDMGEGQKTRDIHTYCMHTCTHTTDFRELEGAFHPPATVLPPPGLNQFPQFVFQLQLMPPLFLKTLVCPPENISWKKHCICT